MKADIQLVTAGSVERVQTPDAVMTLQDEYFFAEMRQAYPRGKTGHASADDDNVVSQSIYRGSFIEPAFAYMLSILGSRYFTVLFIVASSR